MFLCYVTEKQNFLPILGSEKRRKPHVRKPLKSESNLWMKDAAADDSVLMGRTLLSFCFCFSLRLPCFPAHSRFLCSYSLVCLIWCCLKPYWDTSGNGCKHTEFIVDPIFLEGNLIFVVPIILLNILRRNWGDLILLHFY